MSLGPGRRLGPNEVLGPLGAGGMARQNFVMVELDPFELRPLDLVVVPGWVEEMKARLAAAK